MLECFSLHSTGVAIRQAAAARTRGEESTALAEAGTETCKTAQNFTTSKIANSFRFREKHFKMSLMKRRPKNSKLCLPGLADHTSTAGVD